MGEIRFVGTGETRGYPYLVCKKRIVGPGKTGGYPYPVCKKNKTVTALLNAQVVYFICILLKQGGVK